MNHLEMLSDLFSDVNYQQNLILAKASHTCILCGDCATAFNDLSARLEYEISALCQSCQDRIFKKR